MDHLLVRPNHTGAKRVIALLVVVLLLAGIIAIYFWQQSKLDDITRTNQELSTKISQLEADLRKQQTPSAQPSLTPSPVPPTSNMYTSPKGVVIKVTSPVSGATVASPLAVTGEVPGNWSFEASFPIKLLDANGAVITQHAATLQGDWMTDKLVPFSATLIFTKPTSTTGTLVLAKANASGLAQHNDSVSIPVVFQ